MRRTFKPVFYMRGNFVNKEGKCPIVLRITLDNERVTIGTTGITVTPSLWDVKKQRLRGKTTEALQTNKKLDTIASELIDISERLTYEGTLTLDKVKSEYLKVDTDTNTIGRLFDAYIKLVEPQVGVNLSDTSYSKYCLYKERFMAMLAKNYHRKDLMLKELKPVHIQEFKIYLMTVVGQCNNTAVKTLKTLRTIILHGKKLGLLYTDPYLGGNMHMEPVDRGFLTEEEIARMMKKEFEISRLELVRDIFVFSCFTGLAYIDVKYLDKSNIVNLNGVDWIIDERIKTHTRINVPLFDGARRILQKYAGNRKCRGHLLPILSNQKMNSYLKEIAALCGIDKDLTFHMARYPNFFITPTSNGKLL